MREDDPPQALRERLDRMRAMIEEYEKAAEEEKLRKKTYRILERFLKNDFWYKLYSEAPSPESRLYMALSFASGEDKNACNTKMHLNIDKSITLWYNK